MLVITYVSSANALFSENALLELLAQCRENNLRLGVTGLLLYKDGSFMQTIEGDNDVIQKLYRDICGDTRHKGVIQLLEEEISVRAFSNWAMGFRNLNKADVTQVPGYSEFMDKSLTDLAFQANPTSAQKLLLMFRR